MWSLPDTPAVYYCGATEMHPPHPITYWARPVSCVGCGPCPECDGVGRAGRWVCEVCQPTTLEQVAFVDAPEDTTDW